MVFLKAFIFGQNALTCCFLSGMMELAPTGLLWRCPRTSGGSSANTPSGLPRAALELCDDGFFGVGAHVGKSGEMAGLPKSLTTPPSRIQFLNIHQQLSTVGAFEEGFLIVAVDWKDGHKCPFFRERAMRPSLDCG